MVVRGDDMRINAQCVGVVLFALIMIYWSHRSLRAQYFRHCNRDLFRTVMFDQSFICHNVNGILNVLEITCRQAFKDGAIYVFGLFGAMAATVASAMMPSDAKTKTKTYVPPSPPHKRQSNSNQSGPVSMNDLLRIVRATDRRQ